MLSQTPGVRLGFHSSSSSLLKCHTADRHQQASVNRDRGPGHKRSQIACQKSDNSRNLLCAAHLASDMKPIAFGKYSRRILVQRGRPVKHGCIDSTGQDAIRANVLFSIVEGDRSGKPQERVFARNVMCRIALGGH